MQRKLTQIISLLTLVMLLFSGFAFAAVEEEVPFQIDAKAALLMDNGTGKVLFEKNADEKLPMASVTKVMTILMIMEAIDDGRLKLDDKATISEKAGAMGGSQVFLDKGAVHKVEDLLKSIIVASANDASVAMAEKLYGSEEVFVKKMNERATSLGMKNTNFVNSTGLPAVNHYSTARDIAIMSRELLKHPQFHKWSTIWIDYLEHDKNRKTILTNTNRLVRFYDGADGIKTGSTDEAKYCLSATAKRGNFRLITVLLGAPSSKVRFTEAQKMMDHGFANYQSYTLLKANEKLKENIPVLGGKTNRVNAVVDKDYSLLLKKGEDKGIKKDYEIPEKLEAPIKKGQKIGEAIITMDGKEHERIPLISDQEVLNANVLDNFLKILGKWIRK